MNPTNKTVFTDEQKVEITRLYQSGKPLKDICSVFKTTDVTLRKNLRLWGIYRSQQKIDMAVAVFSKEQEALARKLSDEGIGRRQIAKIMNVTLTSLKVLLTKLGIPTNYPSESKERMNEYSRAHRQRRRDAGLPTIEPLYSRAAVKAWRKNNPEKDKALRRRYRQKHKRKIQAKIAARRKVDPAFKLKGLLRCRMHEVLKRGGKSARTLELLGCSYEGLRRHLESQFVTVNIRGGKTFTMTWDNHGQQGWHIDHIKPCVSFDLTDPEQQKACFHWTNLRPLYWEHNVNRQHNDFFTKTA